MTETEIKAALSPVQAVAMTVWAEGRAEPVLGQIAIACVIRNRVLRPARFGDTFRDVCFARGQFSCWASAGGDANFRALLARCTDALAGRATWPAQAVWIATGVIDNVCRDVTGGATHYYAPDAMVPRGRVPLWARGLTPTVTINGHRFFTGVA